jgi:hypothetical protein
MCVDDPVVIEKGCTGSMENETAVEICPEKALSTAVFVTCN